MNAVLKLVDVDFGARELSRPLNLIDAIKDYSDEMPLYCFAPSELQATYRRFAEFFPGQVTYAVKANPEPQIIETLLNEGMAAFDVASLNEIALVRGFSKTAELHYNNPIRSRRENDAAFHQHEVRSFSVDCIGELRKLKEAVADQAHLVEASIRFHLDLGVAGYDFGTKFGATPEEAIALVAEAEALGFRVSLTFHPGSQCRQANAYRQYIEMASQISKAAGCELSTLNVGGGFPVQFPEDKVEDLKVYMDEIVSAVDDAFPEQRPDLVCEPGRAMVANSVALVTKVKAIKGDGRLYLNDGRFSARPVIHLTNCQVNCRFQTICRKRILSCSTIWAPTDHQRRQISTDIARRSIFRFRTSVNRTRLIDPQLPRAAGKDRFLTVAFYCPNRISFLPT